MRRIIEYLETLPRWMVWTISVIFVVSFGYIDRITGPDLSVFVFYLIPVFISTWFLGKWQGIVFSFFGALAWSLADKIYADTGIPYWNLAIELVFFLVMVFLLSELKRSHDAEKVVARTDYLTGAVNGRYFRELAEAEINRANRYLHPFSVVYIDVDNFKAINDTYGHTIGDEVLRQVVWTIRDHIRATDVIARLGGDEFVILFPETGFAMAQTVIEKVRTRLHEVMVLHKWTVTFSLGMVTFLKPPNSVEQMVRIADKAMYGVKNSGKNNVRFEIFNAEEH